MKKYKFALSIFIISLLIGIFCGLYIGEFDFAKKLTGKLTKNSQEQITKDVNAYLAGYGTPYEVKGIEEEEYAFKVTITDGNGQEFPIFVSKDGKYLYQGAYLLQDSLADLESYGNVDASDEEGTSTELTKTDKPSVELFVMSHCPYGTQFEKGILPVVEALGDKIDFELKFVDYAMHDKTELDEQLIQYCIQKDDPERFLDYLACFLNSENSMSCQNQNDIDSAAVLQCVSDTDAEYKVTELYEDTTSWVGGSYPQFNINAEDNEKYGIQGSPSLVINGANASPNNRSPSAILATVCSAFTEAPEECNQELDTAVPAPGFGDGTTNSEANASCN